MGLEDEVDAGAATGRSLRVRKVLKPCPTCKADVAEFMRSAQVNRDMETLIKKLQVCMRAVRAVYAVCVDAVVVVLVDVWVAMASKL